ncbi:MAG: rhodanese-like domain-containing protein [Phycisphaerales bacterium]
MSCELDERGLPPSYPFKEEWEITPRECQARCSEILILDVRQADELAVASVEGATHIPLGELALRIDELGEDDDAEIATLCHHGQRALQAASLLRQYGFDNAKAIAGGIDVWSVACDDGVPRYKRVAGKCVVVAVDSPLKG